MKQWLSVFTAICAAGLSLWWWNDSMQHRRAAVAEAARQARADWDRVVQQFCYLAEQQMAAPVNRGSARAVAKLIDSGKKLLSERSEGGDVEAVISKLSALSAYEARLERIDWRVVSKWDAAVRSIGPGLTDAMVDDRLTVYAKRVEIMAAIKAADELVKARPFGGDPTTAKEASEAIRRALDQMPR